MVVISYFKLVSLVFSLDFFCDQNNTGDGDLCRISNILSQTFPFQRSILLSAITISTIPCDSFVNHSVIIAVTNFLHVFQTTLANFDIIVVDEDYIVLVFFPKCFFDNFKKYFAMFVFNILLNGTLNRPSLLDCSFIINLFAAGICWYKL